MKNINRYPLAAIFAVISLICTRTANLNTTSIYPHVVFYIFWVSLGLTFILGVYGLLSAIMRQRSWILGISDLLSLGILIGYAWILVILEHSLRFTP